MIPNIPGTGATGATLSTDETAAKLRSIFLRLWQDKASEMAQNAACYLNNRQFSKSKLSVTLKKVFKDAVFIPAHPSRFRIGGLDLENLKMFVLHRPGLEPRSATLANIIREFVSANRAASTHFVVGLNGTIVQMVDLQDTAFHTGLGNNHEAVGVEIEGAVGSPITEEAYKAVASLIARISRISGLPIDAEHVKQHLELLPRTKVDVGDPLNLAHLLGLATEMLSQYSTNTEDFFRAPFSPTDMVGQLQQDLQSLAAMENLSLLDMELIRNANFHITATLRAAQFSTIQRGNIAVAAALWLGQQTASTGATVAHITSLIGAGTRTKLQENIRGALWNERKGVFSDGSCT